MTTLNRICDFEKFLFDELKDIAEASEIKSFTLMLMHYLRGYDLKDLMLQRDQLLGQSEWEFLALATARLKKNEPIQYIIGQTEFFGLVFKVDPRVLIPRPETEEMVELILDDNPNSAFKVLDIGTGSGCIPVSLKKNSPSAHIEGWDISAGALELANINARLNEVLVHYKEVDVLCYHPGSEKFNVVVSNPPYVTLSEKKMMGDNVLKYEPHLALFVDDDNPLLFYHVIAGLAKKILTVDGYLYFEINAAFGDEVCCLLSDLGYCDVWLKEDISGRDRIVRAKWPGAGRCAGD